MASFGGIHMYDSALRQPARAALDSMSCAITRGSASNDSCDSRYYHAAPGGLICCSGAVPAATTSALPAFRPARGATFQLMPWGTGVECGVGP
jgi:hypothetical protein